MRTTSNLVKALAVMAVLVTLCHSGLAQTTPTVVYDNSTTDLGKTAFLPSGLEYGDEITLAGTARTVTDFKFEYFLNATGSGTAQVTFYEMNGPTISRTLPDGSTAQYPTPGTVLYSSPILTLGQGYQVADISQIAVNVPNDFTWTVKFNIGGTDSAGLRLYNPPTVGSSFADFWENNNGTWNTYLFDNGATPANFAARVTAVPEAATCAYALLAGLGWVGYLGFKRRS